MRPLVLCVIGTRPEALKMAPVVGRLRRQGSGFDVKVLSTGQHRGLLDRALADFAIVPDHDLGVMRADQDLAGLTARVLTGVSEALGRMRPELVLAQGDTTTVLATALACHYHRIAFGHVEAGLRTGRAFDPFPEEKNRVLASHLATLHFAPTPVSRDNLVREGIADRTIHVTGNTGIDTLAQVAARDVPAPLRPATERFLVVTLHRRENIGPPLEGICGALCEVLDRHPALSLVVPLHLNPRVREVVAGRLGGHERIRLVEPLAYPEFVALMKASRGVLTDSGGVQEEAPALGRPVLVLRATTERPEAVEAGGVRIVGTQPAEIVEAVAALVAAGTVTGPGPEPGPPRHGLVDNPYGDGWASERIVRILSTRFGIDPGPPPAGFTLRWSPPTGPERVRDGIVRHARHRLPPQPRNGARPAGVLPPWR
jgi:UDP-N-acetylglucosamine 2-epimerase (non-hydrolysing)